jgi:hypothetical protein
MKTNPFIEARSKVATIGDCINALIEAFSLPNSADTLGEYILERALEKVKERLPERQKEWNEVMARLYEMYPPIVEKDVSNDKSDTYADTLDAAHELEAHFRKLGEPHHSAWSQVWVLKRALRTYSMQIIPSSNVPKYLIDGEYTTPGIVYAALLQI